MLPVELERGRLGDKAWVGMQINADLPWFSGHFPQQPILPGVAQLDWVVEYATQMLAPGWQFASVENIKFQQPVQPGQRLMLHLEWRAERGQVIFSYQRVADGQQVSSGKLGLRQ